MEDKLNTSFFVQRREALFEQMAERSVALIQSGSELIRNRDVEHPFRAESDFHYLTGFLEPDAVLVLVKSETNQAVLFLRPKDKEKEIWDGRRLGVDQAVETLAVDQAWCIAELEEQLPKCLENIDHIYFSYAQLMEWTPKIEQALQGLRAKIRQGVTAPTSLLDLDSLLHEMRLFKTEQEIEWLRDAAQISVKGHLAAMQAAPQSDYEYQVQAALEGAFKQNGSPRVAFNTIAAGGDNACVLHYTENDAPLNKASLILVDAGAEYKGYAGDITTTFPVGGKFSAEQKALYELVLKAQQASIKAVKPGVPYDVPHQTVLQVLTAGLVELGLLQGSIEELIESEAYKRFFMHGTGHWLGRDVHDVGRYKLDGDWRPLQEGMVLTIEPGLYVAADDDSVAQQWRGIGIRIEDDVLVTTSGHEVLTKGLPRTVEEIEAYMILQGEQA